MSLGNFSCSHRPQPDDLHLQPARASKTLELRRTRDARPRSMQRLLRYARWDADAVRDDIRAYAVE
ncbi:hypothetical protein, partial [Streptomyces broussonetiae]